MRTRSRTGSALLALTTVAVIALAAAPAASAANASPATVYLNGGGSSSCSTPSITDGGSAVTSIQADGGDSITINRTMFSNCYQVTAGWEDSGGNMTFSNITAASSTETVPADTVTVTFGYKLNSGSQVTTIGMIPVTPRTLPPAPMPSNGASSPVLAHLTLSTGTSDVTCTNGQMQGYVGSWITLPSICTKPAAVASSASLLGWSTSPSFPVAIAQRQAANRWGTYEVLAADGSVTAVFVPAGWPTEVTGANTLYPIWG